MPPYVCSCYTMNSGNLSLLLVIVLFPFVQMPSAGRCAGYQYFNEAAAECWPCVYCTQNNLWYADHPPECRRSFLCPITATQPVKTAWCAAKSLFDQGIPRSQAGDCTLPKPPTTQQPSATTSTPSDYFQTFLTTDIDSLATDFSLLGNTGQSLIIPDEGQRSTETSKDIKGGATIKPGIITPTAMFGILKKQHNANSREGNTSNHSDGMNNKPETQPQSLVFDSRVPWLIFVTVFTIWIVVFGILGFVKCRKSVAQLSPLHYWENCKVSYSSEAWGVISLNICNKINGISQRTLKIECVNVRTQVYSKKDEMVRFTNLVPGETYKFIGWLDNVSHDLEEYTAKGPSITNVAEPTTVREHQFKISDWDENFVGHMTLSIAGQPHLELSESNISCNRLITFRNLLPNLQYTNTISYRKVESQKWIGTKKLPPLLTQVEDDTLQWPRFCNVESVNIQGCRCFTAQSLPLTNKMNTRPLSHLPKGSHFWLKWTAVGPCDPLPHGMIEYTSPSLDYFDPCFCNLNISAILYDQEAQHHLSKRMPPQQGSTSTPVRSAFLLTVECRESDKDAILNSDDFLRELLTTQEHRGLLEGKKLFLLVRRLMEELKSEWDKCPRHDKSVIQIHQCLVYLQKFHNRKSTEWCICDHVFAAVYHFQECGGLLVGDLDKLEPPNSDGSCANQNSYECQGTNLQVNAPKHQQPFGDPKEMQNASCECASSSANSNDVFSPAHDMCASNAGETIWDDLGTRKHKLGDEQNSSEFLNRGFEGDETFNKDSDVESILQSIPTFKSAQSDCMGEESQEVLPKAEDSTCRERGDPCSVSFNTYMECEQLTNDGITVDMQTGNI